MKSMFEQVEAMKRAISLRVASRRQSLVENDERRKKRDLRGERARAGNENREFRGQLFGPLEQHAEN